MARARNLKPGFFTNDLLADVDPLGRLLFAGLWTIADREGRLLDRPRKLKAEVLPYDDCDTDALLTQLAARGFIHRYSVNGAALIQVVNWHKHQQPHVHERPSDLPAPEQHPTSTVQAPDEHPTNTPLTLNPLTDSGYRIPDTGEGTPERAAAAVAPTPPPDLEAFDRILQRAPGYDPSPELWRKVLERYGDLDLEEQALKLVGWLRAPPQRAKKRTANAATILNWLKGSRREEPRNGRSRADSVAAVDALAKYDR